MELSRDSVVGPLRYYLARMPEGRLGRYVPSKPCWTPHILTDPLQYRQGTIIQDSGGSGQMNMDVYVLGWLQSLTELVSFSSTFNSPQEQRHINGYGFGLSFHQVDDRVGKPAALSIVNSTGGI